MADYVENTGRHGPIIVGEYMADKHSDCSLMSQHAETNGNLTRG